MKKSLFPLLSARPFNVYPSLYSRDGFNYRVQHSQLNLVLAIVFSHFSIKLHCYPSLWLW